MRPHGVVLFALALAGCGDDERWLPFPDDADAGSVMLAFPNGDRFRFELVDPSDARPVIWLSLEPDDKSYALVFRETPSELELSPGEFEAPLEQAPARPFPAAYLSLEARADATAWTPSSVLPDAISGLKRPGTPCVRFHGVHAVLPDTEPTRPTILVELTDRFLVMLLDGRSFFVDVEGNVAPATDLVGLSTDTPNLGIVRRLQDTYLFGTGGRVWRGNFGEGFTELSPAVFATNETQLWIDASSELETFEAFVANDRGYVRRFDDNGWETVITPPVDHQAGTLAGVLRLGRRHVWAFGVEPQTLHEWKDGVLRATPLGGVITGAPTAIGAHPNLGPLLGSSVGEIRRHDGAGWVTLSGPGESRYALEIRDFTPFGDGFLTAGTSSGLGQYQPNGAGLCTPQSVTLGSSFRILPFTGLYALVVNTYFQSDGVSFIFPER